MDISSEYKKLLVVEEEFISSIDPLLKEFITAIKLRKPVQHLTTIYKRGTYSNSNVYELPFQKCAFLLVYYEYSVENIIAFMKTISDVVVNPDFEDFYEEYKYANYLYLYDYLSYDTEVYPTQKKIERLLKTYLPHLKSERNLPNIPSPLFGLHILSPLCTLQDDRGLISMFNLQGVDVLGRNLLYYLVSNPMFMVTALKYKTKHLLFQVCPYWDTEKWVGYTILDMMNAFDYDIDDILSYMGYEISLNIPFIGEIEVEARDPFVEMATHAKEYHRTTPSGTVKSYLASLLLYDQIGKHRFASHYFYYSRENDLSEYISYLRSQTTDASSRGPSPVAPRGPSPVAPRGPSPVAPRGPSPVAPRGPSPVAQRGPSPVAQRGPSPVAQRGPSPVAPRGPSPVAPRGPSPVAPRGPSPVAPRGPSPLNWASPPLGESIVEELSEEEYFKSEEFKEYAKQELFRLKIYVSDYLHSYQSISINVDEFMFASMSNRRNDLMEYLEGVLQGDMEYKVIGPLYFKKDGISVEEKNRQYSIAHDAFLYYSKKRTSEAEYLRTEAKYVMYKLHGAKLVTVNPKEYTHLETVLQLPSLRDYQSVENIYRITFAEDKTRFMEWALTLEQYPEVDKTELHKFLKKWKRNAKYNTLTPEVMREVLLDADLEAILDISHPEMLSKLRILIMHLLQSTSTYRQNHRDVTCSYIKRSEQKKGLGPTFESENVGRRMVEQDTVLFSVLKTIFARKSTKPIEHTLADTLQEGRVVHKAPIYLLKLKTATQNFFDFDFDHDIIITPQIASDFRRVFSSVLDSPLARNAVTQYFNSAIDAKYKCRKNLQNYLYVTQIVLLYKYFLCHVASRRLKFRS